MRADYNCTDEQFSFANNAGGNLLPSSGVVNVRGGWRSPDQRWEVAVYGLNVFDDEGSGLPR